MCNQVLKKVFADDDCHLISQLRVFIDGSHEIMGDSQYGKDDRLDDCLHQLQSVEDVLKQVFQMEEKLLAARRRVEGKIAQPLTEEQVRKMLEEIDEADDPEEMIDKVFDAYAAPGEDVVRGEGKVKLTQAVA